MTFKGRKEGNWSIWYITFPVLPLIGQQLTNTASIFLTVCMCRRRKANYWEVRFRVKLCGMCRLYMQSFNTVALNVYFQKMARTHRAEAPRKWSCLVCLWTLFNTAAPCQPFIFFPFCVWCVCVCPSARVWRYRCVLSGATGQQRVSSFPSPSWILPEARATDYTPYAGLTRAHGCTPMLGWHRCTQPHPYPRLTGAHSCPPTQDW